LLTSDTDKYDYCNYFLFNNKPMLICSTEYGNGSYPVYYKGEKISEFCVDSGLYCIIKKSYIKSLCNTNLFKNDSLNVKNKGIIYTEIEFEEIDIKQIGHDTCIGNIEIETSHNRLEDLDELEDE
jgi:hypothetical protein